VRRLMLFASASLTLAGTQACAEDLPVVSEVVVVGPRAIDRIPGAATVVQAGDYERSQPLSVNDVLRRVPGLFLRGEEGLGLRPNIGFRGLNPTRSSEVLLLEDGLPLTYAPYGDNATYYHPPMERFSRVEVLKGSGQIAFGPHTVGGVVNYVTPNPPVSLQGRLILRVGERETEELVLQGGNTWGRLGVTGTLAARHSAGMRSNHDLNYEDLSIKGVYALNQNQEVTVKLSAFEEDSQVSYSGLTLAEYLADPRSNPFPNDRFAARRYGASLSHGWNLGDRARLTTSAYAASFDRDWWRQSSNSEQRPSDASDSVCGGMSNLNTTCGNEGRLRQYEMYGLETRLALNWVSGSLGGAMLAGVRVHSENQDRRQVNGDRPDSRAPGVSVNAGLREHNLRHADAVSAFIQNTLEVGRFSFKPGLRYESIRFERFNRLNGLGGNTTLDAWIPGFGVSWAPASSWTLFAGVHRGFSPPRVEDIITNTGGSVELKPEESLNWELGARGRPAQGWAIELAAFQMDFNNQIIPASLSGGVGATSTSAGKTHHQGIEGAVRFSSKAAFETTVDWYGDATFTWVKEASFQGPRFSSVTPTISVSANRIPYAPEWTARLAAGLDTGIWQAEIEALYTGKMFTDDLNTIAVTANGQRGLIKEALQWNLATAWTVPGSPVKVTAAVRNLANQTFIVDRARGILVNEPRMARVGLEIGF